VFVLVTSKPIAIGGKLEPEEEDLVSAVARTLRLLHAADFERVRSGC